MIGANSTRKLSRFSLKYGRLDFSLTRENFWNFLAHQSNFENMKEYESKQF